MYSTFLYWGFLFLLYPIASTECSLLALQQLRGATLRFGYGLKFVGHTVAIFCRDDLLRMALSY